MTNSAAIVTIIDRIKKIRNLKSDNDVAEALKMSRTALAERKRRDSVPFEELVRFCEENAVSFEWLVWGGSKKEGIFPQHKAAEEAAPFTSGSVRDHTAAGKDNQAVIGKMVRQLTDIINEGDYRKTVALQALLDVLSPGEKKE